MSYETLTSDSLSILNKNPPSPYKPFWITIMSCTTDASENSRDSFSTRYEDQCSREGSEAGLLFKLLRLFASSKDCQRYSLSYLNATSNAAFLACDIHICPVVKKVDANIDCRLASSDVLDLNKCYLAALERRGDSARFSSPIIDELDNRTFNANLPIFLSVKVGGPTQGMCVNEVFASSSCSIREALEPHTSPKKNEKIYVFNVDEITGALRPLKHEKGDYIEVCYNHPPVIRFLVHAETKLDD
jgi:hypothetical protein